MTSGDALSRRTVLGLAALGLAGCKSGSSRPAPHVDPDASALASARASEIELLGVTTDPVQHAAHLRHLAALGATAPIPSAPATPVTESVRSLLRSSAASMRGAAAVAVGGTHAAAFASIAASHQVMLDG